MIPEYGPADSITSLMAWLSTGWLWAMLLGAL
jgi:hypothetical protein